MDHGVYICLDLWIIVVSACMVRDMLSSPGKILSFWYMAGNASDFNDHREILKLFNNNFLSVFISLMQTYLLTELCRNSLKFEPSSRQTKGDHYQNFEDFSQCKWER